MPKPVIAAIDAAHEDVAPAALGALLARLLGEPLVLTTVYAVDLAIDNLISEYAEHLEREAQDALERVAASLRETDVLVSVRAVGALSSPAGALHQLAEREDASVLVLGSSRRGTVGRVFPSAVTDRLLHGAPCPVAIAPSGYSMADVLDGVALIGAAYVDSADGQTALAMAKRLADAADGKVRVLTVAEPLGTLVAGNLAGTELELARQGIDESAQKTLDKGLALVGEDRSAGGKKLAGPVARSLAGASDDLDLLVCGSRGHGPLRTLMLGGTSHELVRKASCPVLVVPRGTPVSADEARDPEVAAA
jgi:nucleotide-binding universal stress UspA family protein